jgi:hypothetical protein
MKNKNCHLFKIKNLIDWRDSDKIGRALQEILEPHDFGYLANITDDDIDIFIACFELEKIKILEKIFKENHVLIDSNVLLLQDQLGHRQWRRQPDDGSGPRPRRRA